MRPLHSRPRTAAVALLSVVTLGALAAPSTAMIGPERPAAARSASSTPTTSQSGWDETKAPSLTLAQIGDLHGHLISRPHLREDGTATQAGGLARVRTAIERVRAQNPDTLLFNVGDTIQGGAEALYTRGEAMVTVLDDWGIDGYSSGNWDFLYGTERYLELFGGGRWGALAANLYYDETGRYADKGGQRVLPPYRVRTVNGVRVGVIGFTTDRGPSAGDGKATAGFRFTDGEAELPVLVDTLRTRENVDVVVVLSEFGLGKNIELAEKVPGVDVMLSSDMHEETPELVRTSTGTLVSEVGQDGTRLAQLDLQVDQGAVKGWRYAFQRIDDTVEPHRATQQAVESVRRPFVGGTAFTPATNPINGTTLSRPIDTVVGRTDVALYRGNFTDHAMPGVVEGTSHNLLADAFRERTGAEIGILHGFRYGTHVSPGYIRFEDLQHFMPIGASIARGTVTGQQLKDHLERSINGVISPDLGQWTAGWMPALSGVTYDLDPYRANGSRVSNVMVQDPATGRPAPLDPARSYTIGGYWYPQQPGIIGGGLKISDTAQPVTSSSGEVLDANDVVAAYLATRRADPSTGRIRLVEALPLPVHGNREIQPLRGVPTTR